MKRATHMPVGSILSSNIVNRYYHYAIDCCTFSSMALFLREQAEYMRGHCLRFAYKLAYRIWCRTSRASTIQCNGIISFYYYVFLMAFGCVRANYTVIHCIYLSRFVRILFFPLYSHKVIQRPRYLSTWLLFPYDLRAQFSSQIQNSKRFEDFCICKNCTAFWNAFGHRRGFSSIHCFARFPDSTQFSKSILEFRKCAKTFTMHRLESSIMICQLKSIRVKLYNCKLGRNGDWENWSSSLIQYLWR